jgi:uncharacterized protein
MSEVTSEGHPRSAAPGAQQHTVALSAALHLLPGVLIAAFYFLVGVPIAEGLDYPSLFGLLLSVGFVLLPSRLGWLLYLGSRRNSRPSLEGVVLYRERMPVRRLVLLGLALLVWAVLVSASLSRLDALLFEAFFSWVQERFVIEQGLGSYLTGYPTYRVSQVRPDLHVAPGPGA